MVGLRDQSRPARGTSRRSRRSEVQQLSQDTAGSARRARQARRSSQSVDAELRGAPQGDCMTSAPGRHADTHLGCAATACARDTAARHVGDHRGPLRAPDESGRTGARRPQDHDPRLISCSACGGTADQGWSRFGESTPDLLTCRRRYVAGVRSDTRGEAPIRRCYPDRPGWRSPF